jgi:benzaldehyde dehydrogenase (NAD)
MIRKRPDRGHMVAGRAPRPRARRPGRRLVDINDQTVADEATIPFGGVGASGNGGRLGGARANLEAFTETQWVTIRGDLPAYPF